ncbi:hypothetical protein SAMN04489720_2527 [Agrococcus jejuensis]|uniref:Uncharacterized protein n=1 Tax=Agrococcus jejuensis TaxID=399736 RepID=A0A1G8FL64_9MICO|nr:hypothetical protein SAMN04489720_2527 [Agrococcus jejuensis]
MPADDGVRDAWAAAGAVLVRLPPAPAVRGTIEG